MTKKIISFLDKNFRTGMEINVYNLFPVAVIGAFAHFVLYFYHLYFLELRESPSLRMFALLICLISVKYSLYLKNKNTLRISRFFPIYWHIMLIVILPLIITYHLLLNDFHYIWLWWMIFMPICLSIFIPNWFIYAFDLIVGILIACLLHYFFQGYLIADNNNVDYISYSLVLIFTTFAGLLFVYGNRRAWLETQSEQHKELTSLTSSIVHEIRNPIGALRLNIENLTLDASLVDFKRHSNNIIKIANDIINMTLRQLSGQNFTKQDFSYNTAYKAVIDAVIIYGYKDKDEKNKINISLNNKEVSAAKIDKEIVSVIDVDKNNNFIFSVNDTAFKYIIFNLLKNALYYLKDYPDSMITINFEENRKITKNIINKFNLNEDIRRYNVVSVTDTGPGIKEEIITQIFNSYFTSGKEGGTGVGLDFCHRVMNDFGGAIICESEFGKYTTFSLLFPILSDKEIKEGKREIARIEEIRRREKAKGKSDEEIERAISQTKKELLFIDDVPMNIEILKSKILKQCPNFKITLIESPTEAIELIKRRKEEGRQFDLILTDYEMPKINGGKLVTTIRNELEITKGQLPIIIYSSRDEEELINECKNIGANAYYVKGKESPFIARNLSKWILNDYIPEISVTDYILKDKNIIIVDDQQINIMVASRGFKKVGANMNSCSDGDEALALFEKHNIDEYDLIITDINMKRVGGIELAHKIREIEDQYNKEHNTKYKIPIIALSGESSKKAIFQMLNNHIDDVFIKGKTSSDDMIKLSKFWIDYRNGRQVRRESEIITIDNQIGNQIETDNIDNKLFIDIDVNYLDVNYMKQFISDKESLLDLIDMYESASNEAITEIDNTSDDPNDIYPVIHKIKGINASFGTVALFKYVKEITEIVKNGELPKEDFRSKIKQLFKETMNEVERLRDERNV